MRATFGALLMTLIATSAGANIPDEVLALRDQGEYTAARERLAELAAGTEDPVQREALLFEAERLRRVAMDFTLTADEVLEAVRETLPDVTAADIGRWREGGWVQARVIDGEMRYFRRAPSNLFRRCPEARDRRDAFEPEPGTVRLSRLRKLDRNRELEQRIRHVIEEGRQTDDGLCAPLRYRVTYTLTVHPGEVPEGETIRCWLMFPREEPHQTDVTLLFTEPAEHILAPPDALQRTVYMERPSAGDEPTVFRADYEYTAWGSYREIDPDAVEPHDPDSDVCRQFTAEEPPHIVFTPEVRALAQQIVGDETNPYLQAKRIFDWMDANVRWIGEREYSTLLNISDICLERKAGDCGVQAITFITLCRCLGIPARWESGWHPQPSSPNMHDWARFHVEPYGWLWADPSMGHYPSFEGEEAQHFFFGNTEGYRLVANAAYSQPLVPPKQHFRSEPVDFQRGEVEWDGGNLYFNQWDWDMELEVVE